MNQARQPHFDRPRMTREGRWITECRLLCGLRQSDMAAVLRSIDARLGNQGRPSEFETGKRPVLAEVIKSLHTFFREQLGDICPSPPFGGGKD